jgi:hypothetical protein
MNDSMNSLGMKATDNKVILSGLVIVALIAGMILSSCSTVSPCVRENQDYFETMDDILSRLDTVNEEALSLAQENDIFGNNIFKFGTLASEIENITEEYRAISPPECAIEVHEGVNPYILLIVSGMLTYFQNGPEEGLQSFETARDYRELITERWDEVKNP